MKMFLRTDLVRSSGCGLFFTVSCEYINLPSFTSGQVSVFFVVELIIVNAAMMLSTNASCALSLCHCRALFFDIHGAVQIPESIQLVVLHLLTYLPSSHCAFTSIIHHQNEVFKDHIIKTPNEFCTKN